MNRAEIVFDAVTNVREELIEEALNYRFYRRSALGRYGPWLALAACLAIVVTLSWDSFWTMGGSDSNGSATENWAPGIQAPESSGDRAPQDPWADGENDGSLLPGDYEDSDAPEGSETPVHLRVLVLEVREDGLLVEVLDGGEGHEELLSQILLLPAENLTATGGISAGGIADVSWYGEIDWEAEIPTLQGALTVEPVQGE